MKRLLTGLALAACLLAAPAAAQTGLNCTGGAITTGLGFTRHEFDTGGTLSVLTAQAVDYFLSGGGASGGGLAGGGGGGGGHLVGTAALAAGTYPVGIGPGGAATNMAQGIMGGGTTALGLTAIGGGAANENSGPGGNGGSGGGAGALGGPGGVGSQGANGGGGSTVPPYPAGGGGGGAYPGSNGSGSQAGAGGLGTQWADSGEWYDGGGGAGSTTQGAAPGAGGYGGGGNGAPVGSNGQAGSQNTGGGGGGSDNNHSGGPGGSGAALFQCPSSLTVYTNIIVNDFVLPTPGLYDTNRGYRNTTDHKLRGAVIDPTKKTLILLSAGQSLRGAEAPTGFAPTNYAAVDNFNIYDGQLYDPQSLPLGSSWVATALGQTGSCPSCGYMMWQVADLFISNGVFNRVIVAPLAAGGSAVGDWATGSMRDRLCVAMYRLSVLGITPSTPGVTFAMEWGQGESNNPGTQSSYQAALSTVISNLKGCGFVGRMFIAEETMLNGVVSAPVQAAQAAVVDNVTVFAGFNFDSITASGRYPDITHLNDAGRNTGAVGTYAAMHATGAPF